MLNPEVMPCFLSNAKILRMGNGDYCKCLELDSSTDKFVNRVLFTEAGGYVILMSHINIDSIKAVYGTAVLALPIFQSTTACFGWYNYRT